MSEFTCEPCSYSTHKRFLYQQHCASQKHIMLVWNST